MNGRDANTKSGIRALLIAAAIIFGGWAILRFGFSAEIHRAAVSAETTAAAPVVASDARDDPPPTGAWCAKFGNEQSGYPEAECTLMRKRWANYFANRGIPCDTLISIHEDSQSPLVRVTCRRSNAPPYTIDNPPFDITSFAGTTDAGQPRGEVAQITSDDQWDRILNMTRAAWSAPSN
jgi:hypothetical protein